MDSPSARNPLSQTPVEEQTDIFVTVTRRVVCKVKLTETVKDLKESLCWKGAIVGHIHDLSYKNTLLEDGGTLAGYGIRSNSTLRLTDGLKLFVEIPSKRRRAVVIAGAGDTVGSIKSMIEIDQGIDADEFILLYNGIILEEGRTLASFNICNESTLHLALCQKDVLTLLVKSCNSAVKIQVKPTSTVGDVKEIAAMMLGVSAEGLIYQGETLKESKNFACYNIKHESIIELVPSKFQIFVKTWSGKTIVLDVRPSSTVGYIKNTIFEKLGVPIHLQSINYAGKRLEDEEILESYGIRQHCTLNMVLVASSRVTPGKLKSFCGVFSKAATVRNVKVEMKRRGYDVKDVLFNGVVLKDKHIIGRHGIDESDEVVVVEHG